MKSLGFGKVSQSQFEELVRDAWEMGAARNWSRYEFEMAVKIARLVSILSSQPELINGRRLVHNLGEVKMCWLRNLMGMSTFELRKPGRPRKETP